MTALAPELTAEHLQAVTKIVSSQGFNIETVTRLSGRLDLEEAHNFPRRACVQFGLSGQMLDAQAMRAACLSLSGELNIDVAVQEDNAYRRNRRLVCFDMDSTLIEQEVIDEIALEAGVGEQVAEITERAMQGELDFQQSFRARRFIKRFRCFGITENCRTFNHYRRRGTTDFNAQSIGV